MQNKIKKINQDFQMTVKITCKLHIAKRKKSTMNLHARTQIEKKTSNVYVSTKSP